MKKARQEKDDIEKALVENARCDTSHLGALPLHMEERELALLHGPAAPGCSSITLGGRRGQAQHRAHQQFAGDVGLPLQKVWHRKQCIPEYVAGNSSSSISKR